jgi:hypothetical protein
MMPEHEWREAVIAEARTWERTPYEMNQCCKSAGVDCARFIYAVYRHCGLIQEEQIGIFGGDWSCHVKEEIYVFRMLRHAVKVLESVSYPTLKAEPGNVALVRTVEPDPEKKNAGHAFDHAAIVVRWPLVLHAAPEHVKEVDASTHWLWAHKTVKIFDPWEKMRNGLR